MNQKIDQLNCGLIVLSCLVACVTPFGLLVLAYAVLGPLHCLTEILWLDDRKYFLPNKKDARWLSGLAIGGIVLSLVTVELAKSNTDTLREMALHTQQLAVTVTLIAVALPLVLWRFSRTASRLIAMSLVGLAGAFVYYRIDAHAYYLVLAVLLPTILHVVVFTAAFMLAGAIKTKSDWGMIALGLLLGCSAATLMFDWPQLLDVDNVFVDAYTQTIGHVHMSLLPWLAADNPQNLVDNLSPTALSISRFLAFAYTYHYLNWFSKTAVIGWDKVGGVRWRAMLALWVACMLLYLVDFSLGLTVAGMLSLFHVFLELPLNWCSFQFIGNRLLAAGATTELDDQGYSKHMATSNSGLGH